MPPTQLSSFNVTFPLQSKNSSAHNLQDFGSTVVPPEYGSCGPGFFSLMGNCYNYNECAHNDLNDCPENTECIDTDGSYECECKEGFYKAGEVCFDVHECSDSELFGDDLLYDCPDNSDCVDTKGSYTCECKEGYESYMEPGDTKPRACFKGCQTESKRCTGLTSCTNVIDPESDSYGYACLCPDGELGTCGEDICAKPENQVEVNMYDKSRFKIMTQGQNTVVYRIRLPRVPDTADYTGFFVFSAEFCGEDFIEQLDDGRIL